MLHNVKINAGQHTNIAKQGRFINVVLAAGVIEARIRLNDGQMFQTQLVSGMAFPVPNGFQSASFSSSSDQQVKVWLSDLPLTYSPLESRVVGSSAVVSSAHKVYYGKVTELIPAESGRGKVVISPQEDIYIGGVGVVPTSAIKIDAGTRFEISTQGALHAYSLVAKNAAQVATVANENSTLLAAPKPVGLTSVKASAFFDGQDGAIGKVLVDHAGKLSVIDNDNGRALQDIYTTPFLNGYGVAIASDYYVLRKSGADVYLVKINMLDFSSTETIVYTHTENVGYVESFCLSVDKIGFNLYVSGTYHYIFGDRGGLAKKVTPPYDLNEAPHGVILSTGELVLRFNTTLARTADGVEWSTSALGFAADADAPIYKDAASDIIYQPDSGILMKSLDKGASWEVAYHTGSGWEIDAVSAVGGNITLTTLLGIHVSQSDGSFKFFPVNNLSARAISPTRTGEVYCMGNDFKIVTGDVEEAGGLDVAVLREVN